ncbi:DUF6232 family protein [Sulfurospirillum cavolei]|uniref:DUF6232 family protein n=1 Tax=Sulfurospirillum cavolei TaxID=366522 RepID=UPI0007649BCA|nr:DUF6232 family protein [Sulfurospirillum cavolei]
MEEKVFFDNGHFKITNIRFINGNQTYLLNGITSIKASSFIVTNSDFVRTLILFIFLISMIGLILTKLATLINFLILGIVLALIAKFFYKKRTKYILILQTSSGESEALTTFNKEFFDIIKTNLDNAIVARG